MRRMLVLPVLISTVLLSGCTGSSGPSSTVAGDAAPCEQLSAADDMRLAVGSVAEIELTQARADADGVLRDVGCAVAADDGQRAISVGLSINVTPCSVPPGFEVDAETGGFFSTATNGGVGFGICTSDGAHLHSTYLSFVEVPGPSRDQVKSIAMQTLEQLELLKQIGTEAVAGADATLTEGCLKVPEVLTIGGVPFEGCVLDEWQSDVGTVSVVAIEGATTFESLSDALRSAGLENVFCSDEGGDMFCGWNGGYGNVDQFEVPASSSDNTWGIDTVWLDVTKF